MKRKHHGLKVWQKSIELVRRVYVATERYPRHELYGLDSQMRRAAVSIPSNVAEGAGRKGDKEFLRYLVMARGSLCELETQVVIGRALGYLSQAEALEPAVDHVFGLLGALINKVSGRPLVADG